MHYYGDDVMQCLSEMGKAQAYIHGGKIFPSNSTGLQDYGTSQDSYFHLTTVTRPGPAPIPLLPSQHTINVTSFLIVRDSQTKYRANPAIVACFICQYGLSLSSLGIEIQHIPSIVHFEGLKSSCQLW
jgi:hypothetical protein